MEFDIGTIKHLGLQMYSTLPPVIAELVSNAWDAGASRVDIDIPLGTFGANSCIVITDDGDGMSDSEIREGYLVVGRDRRVAEESDERKDPPVRKYMGRKGIGKFSGFGIARKVEVESCKDGHASRFVMDFDLLEQAAKRREIAFEALHATGQVGQGTRITLSAIQKYRNRSVSIGQLRRSLARRFSVIDTDFVVSVNDTPLTPDERDLRRLVANDRKGAPYLWEFNEEISPNTGWVVKGWIGALKQTDASTDGIPRGVVVMARGKLVQEPFFFEVNPAQQYALAYLVGELHAEFVDGAEDTVSTARNGLVWDNEANEALLSWGQRKIHYVAREWARRRKGDNLEALEKNRLYVRFKEEAEKTSNKRSAKAADRLIRDLIQRNPDETPDDIEKIVEWSIDYLEYDAFWELAQEVREADVSDPAKLVSLFREWEIVEAKEMSRVTEGRIETIRKLQQLIAENALEVPTLHNFLREFPWVLDPRWTLVDDEVTFSSLLKDKFPESDTELEEDKRIDFLCVRESDSLVVVEIKRPQSVASKKELDQIERYVSFLRHHVRTATDPEFSFRKVVGYLLCGRVASGFEPEEKVENLRNSEIYVRHYSDLLGMVERSHKDFLSKYGQLRSSRAAQIEAN
ncbi:ATP-binding protein [Streptomyces lunaelactis]|uniref:ATP-binding protein n=1 Tax=Streptomyces lunaelactis TaxID=1535768 RepID=UPI00158593DD|nr:ATP-binding protein [Streptomyces lunaelactis]NUK60260.1 ATP-binding protein [Streptomyces lunaelactis]